MGQDHTHKNADTARQNRRSQTADRPRHRTGTNSPNGTRLPARPMERIARQAIPAHDGIERQKERGIPITPIRQAPRQVTPADQALHWGRGCFGEDVRQAYNSVQGGNRQERAFGFELDDQPENRQRICRTLQHERHHILDSAQAR